MTTHIAHTTNSMHRYVDPLPTMSTPPTITIATPTADEGQRRPPTATQANIVFFSFYLIHTDKFYDIY